jgi:hypothetical protein
MDLPCRENGGAKGATLAIAALILWVLTASAGVSLLSSGRAARGAAAGPAQPADAAGGPAPPADAAGGPDHPADAAAGPAQTAGAPARFAAIPLTEDGRPPPVPHAKVAAPPGEHPLLQFSHPALALIGFGFWLAFVLVHYRPLAWISFGILVVTLSAGLSWLGGNALAARRRQGAARGFPPRLIVLHGLAAAATLALTVLTALSAGHG